MERRKERSKKEREREKGKIRESREGERHGSRAKRGGLTCARVCLGGQPMPPTYASFSLSSTTNNRSIISARGLLLAYFGRSPSPFPSSFFFFFYYVANPTLPRYAVHLSDCREDYPTQKLRLTRYLPLPFSVVISRSLFVVPKYHFVVTSIISLFEILFLFFL